MAPAPTGIIASMPDADEHARRRRPRRRPFGVLVICGLLAFQAVLLVLLIVGLLEVDTTDMAATELALKAFGVNLSIATDAELAVQTLIVIFATLFALTFVEAVLLLLLRRIGWILTMLVVGVALFAQLVATWLGAAVNSTSLLLYALTALYLNQSDVRRAFGIGASRIDRVIALSADAVDGAMGDAS
jgi:hypothetical protein